MKKFFRSIWNFIRPKKHYKYLLNEAYRHFDEELKGFSFRNEWVTIHNGQMIVNKDYAWDGCSPKVKMVGVVVGVPDGKFDECKFPSLIHDVFCQFIKVIPVTKKIVVGIFLKMLKAVKWYLADEYAYAVDKFGPQDFMKGD